MDRRFATCLTLLAILTFLHQPMLCDLLHTLPAHAHDAADPHDPDDGPDHHGHDPRLEPAHRCCDGHDQPPVLSDPRGFVKGPLGTEGPPLGTLPVALLPSCGRTPSRPFPAPDIASLSHAQGNPCALFCRWLI